MNKQITLTLLIIVLATQFQFAQQSIKSTAEKSKAVSLSQLKNGGQNSPDALWDVQDFFDTDVSINPLGNYAGICWTGTEFWVSRYSSDSLFTLDALGNLTASFKVTGVGTATNGVRGMTYDGVFIYVSDNTTSIKIIDPATKTLNGTIATSTGYNIRSITFDPTANNNQGGFWVSNFNTDIDQIDLSGNILNTIAAATHTLNGMYGSAFDSLTTGGPYLWVFSQGANGQAANVVRLQLPTGTPTFVNHNANTEVVAQGGVAGIAGGLFITDSYLPGSKTIMGVVQSSPDYIIAWELNDATQIAVDGAIDTVNWLPAYTQVPLNHVSSVSFPAVVANKGGTTLTTVDYTVDILDAGSPVFNASASANNLASNASINLNPASTWLPSLKSQYDVSCTVALSGQTDLDNSNDSINFQMFVGDSVFAYDDGTATSGLGIGNGTGGTLGQSFILNSNDLVKSVTFICNGPTAGDSVNVNFYSYSGTPQTIIGYSPTYIFTAADTDGVVLTLPIYALNGGPLSLAAGTYFVGVNEYNFNVTLGTTSFNYRPGLTWVLFGANPWANNENYGFKRTYVLRLNVAGTSLSVNENNNQIQISVFPNPATDIITIQSESINSFSKVEVIDVQGKICIEQNFSDATQYKLNTLTLSNGSYNIRITTDKGYINKSVKVIR